MIHISAVLMIVGCVATLAVTGLPGSETERDCHGARRGSIVEITTCPSMPEKVKVEPVG